MSQVPPLPPHSPQVPFAPLPRYTPGVGTFTISDAFSVGWPTLKDNYGVLLGSSLLCILVYWGGSILGGLVPLLGTFVGFFLAPLWVSLSHVFVRAVRGHTVTATEFFEHLKVPYWSLVVIQLLIWAIGLAVMLPMIIIVVLLLVGGGFAAGAGGGGGGAGAVLLFVIAGFVLLATIVGMAYIQARIGYAGLLFMDAPPGSLEIVESVKLSWTRTKEFAWPLVGMSLLLGLIAFGCILALFFPLFLFAIPLSLAVTAAAYDMICPPKYSGSCPVCGYDCRNSPPGTCPECGAALPVG